MILDTLIDVLLCTLATALVVVFATLGRLALSGQDPQR